MNNIQLNIVANAQFQQVYAEVAKLKEAMLSLQKASVGGPFTPQVTASIRQAQNAFDSAVLSTRAFTIEHVAMSSSVEKFGKQLSAGQLSLSSYYRIWRDSAKGVSSELDALATSQARLNRSVAIADPLRPGYAKLVTDINGVVTAQEKAIFYQRALNTALQQGSMKLIDFGKNTQWMGRQLTVGLTMPLAMFGAGVSSAFLNVDKELTRMQKVYGTGLIQPTQAALKQIRSDVMALGNELARTLGTSVQETAAMSADLAATGLEGAKLIGATREAIRLATLGELDHQQAMQATISLQNVYKLNTQGLSNAVNFLNAVENQTSTSLQDLVDAIPRVGPIVQQLGGSFKDTAAMMVAMKEAGVPAAQGANAIKSALSSLINPTKAAQTAFKQYNIDLSKIATDTGGAPILMLKTLADQMKNLDRLSQAQLIEKMFGKFQYARIQALLDNINKSGTQTATVFKLMGASTLDLASLATNELKQQTESASGRFKRMVETLKADALPIGNMFLNSFSRIGAVIDKIISAFRGLAHLLGPTAKMFGTLFGGGLAGLIVIGPVIMLVGLFANLFGNILRGANAIRMFKQGLDAAGPSENKFLAGLHAMRNFYQDLDKSAIAARNQMELMPEAITSNATAFEILRKSIFDLTAQFTALAAAQREAMGMGAVAAAETGLGAFKIPFKAPGMATGGWVPGNPAAGDVYPAMLTGKEAVIKYPNSVKHASIINAIMDDNLPGYGNGLTQTSGYQVINIPENPITGKKFAVIGLGENGMNERSYHTGRINTPDWLPQGASHMGTFRTEAEALARKANLEGIVAQAVASGFLSAKDPSVIEGIEKGSIPAMPTVPTGLRGITYGLGGKEYKPTIGAYASTNDKYRGLNEQLAGEGASPATYLESLAEATGKTESHAKYRTSITDYLEAATKLKDSTGKSFITQEHSEKILAEINDELESTLLDWERQGKLITDINNPLDEIARKVMLKNKNLSADPAQFESSWRDFESSHSNVNAPTFKYNENTGRWVKTSGAGTAKRNISVSAGDFGDISIPNFKGVKGESKFLHSRGAAFEKEMSLKSETEAELQGQLDQAAYEKGRKKQAAKTKGKNDLYEVNRSTQRSAHPKVAKDAADDAKKYSDVTNETMEKELAKETRSSKFASKYSIAGRLSQRGGRLGAFGAKLGGLGSAATGIGGMAASMALNAAPNKIGETDISGAKGILSNVAGVASMAAFIPGVNAFLPEIAIGTALFSGVQWAFKRADTERKKFEQGVKETYAKLESTPDKFLEKLNTQIKDSDSTVNKYKNMSIYGRIYGDTLLNVASNIASGTLKGKQMDVMLQQISASAKNSTTEFNALYLAAQNAGNADMTKLLSQLKLVYGAGQQAVSAFMQVQQLIAAGVDVSNANFKDPNTLRKLYGVAITNTQSQIDTLKKQHGAGSGIADPTKVLDARIKKEEKVLKTLEDQLKTMQDQAKVIQQQNDYYNKQTDLTNQIKEAQVSGQYIKAAQLRTVMGQQSAQFKQQQIMDAKQAQIDAKKAEIDSLNAKKQALDAAAAQTAATVNNTAAILNLQSQIKTFQDALNHLPLPKPGSTETSFLAEHGSSLTGAKNYKPGDSAPKLQIGATGSYYPGVSLPTLTNVYDKYTSSSFKIPSQNKSTVVGPSANNSTQNITFNISGVSNPDEVVRQVMSKLNTANAKRNTSNLVGGHR